MTAPEAREAPPPSLRRELAWRLSAGVMLAWLVALAAAGLVLKARTDRIFDSALRETAERILPLAIMEIDADAFRRAQIRGMAGSDRRGSGHDDDHGDDHDDDHDDDDDDDHRPRVIAPRAAPAPAPDMEYVTYVVRDAAGRVQLYSHDADLEVFAAPPVAGISTAEGHRIYALADSTGQFWVQAAEPVAVRRAALLTTLALMLLPLAVVMPLGLYGIGRIVRRGLMPVEVLAAEVARRGAHDLSPLPGNGDMRAELLPIREAVNRMMARVSRALEAERTFASNAAHELRTPIAATLAQTQRLRSEAPEGPLRDRARTVEAQLKRMARLAEKLLQLARAEGGGVIAETPRDLVPILAALHDDISRDLPPGRLRLSLPEVPVPSRLDPDAFGVLARNLVENALLHGTPDATVALSLAGDGILRIENDCPPVPAEVLARLTTRFERGGAAVAGSGLGLTIAAGIAAALGRDLYLASPLPGSDRGFLAQVDVRY